MEKGHIKCSPEQIVLDNGIIVLHDSIGECSSEDIITYLSYLYIKKIQPVKIYVCSPGGYVFNGIAIYDFIRTITGTDFKVFTIGQGEVASLGGILLQAGSTRIMQKNAWLLIHEISSFYIGKTSVQEEELKQCKRLQDEVLLEILAERSKLSKKEIKRKWKKTDWWLSAEEAKELGFCDKIV